MRISRILVPAAMIAASSIAFANDPGSDGHGTLSFSSLDKDQNGELAKTELSASSMYSKHFSKIDADGNGTLSKTEVHDHLVAMGISPDKMNEMDHSDMQGMDHGDATKSDHSDMDAGGY